MGQSLPKNAPRMLAEAIIWKERALDAEKALDQALRLIAEVAPAYIACTVCANGRAVLLKARGETPSALNLEGERG